MIESNKTKIQTMLAMQDTFNSRVYPDWREKKFMWSDAIWTEASEALNHTRWEWWKTTGDSVDLAQTKLEIADIWHFLMSEIMTYEPADNYTHDEFIAKLYDIMLETKPAELTGSIEDVRDGIRGIASAALAPRDSERPAMLIVAFSITLLCLNMDWPELYKLYIGKNTLNKFRQDKGYKAETAAYKSVWAKSIGGEDNEYLTELLMTLNVDSPTFKEDLYSNLEGKYVELSGVVYDR